MRKLLFELNTWHSLAKLRLHTETTIKDLEHSTTRLGAVLRKFQEEVCSAYKTFELPSEEAARVRRQASAAKKASQPKPINLLMWASAAHGMNESLTRLFK